MAKLNNLKNRQIVEFYALNRQNGDLRKGYIMTDQAKKQRNEYAKKWREANKEKTKEYNQRYWEKKASKES